MIDIPIVAVHSAQNYSWNLCLKVAAQDAILFYSTKPLENDKNVERERFLGEYHVPHEKANGLYHALREIPPVQDIVTALGLEKKDPETLFRKLVVKRKEQYIEQQARLAPPVPSALSLRLLDMRRNYNRVAEAYVLGQRGFFTASEMGDYEMVRARMRLEDQRYR